MKRIYTFYILCIIGCFLSLSLCAEGIHGTVYDSATRQPLPGASVLVMGTSIGTSTNEFGHYELKGIVDGTYQVQASFIGYHGQVATLVVSQGNGNLDFYLGNSKVQLSEIVISSQRAHDQQIISHLDISLRPINNSQEILRMVPGLFIGQHAGGGKAEQIFLRGFDLDHGTDIRITVDGMPVNMVSHAHGQGYADLHFVIPELVQAVNFKKGPYHAEKGNLTTAGWVDFKTRSALDRSFVKVEAGQFQSYRTVAGVDLLGSKARAKKQSAYLASEYSYSRSYFDAPQNFKRFNLMGKYNGQISKNSILTITGSTFWSKWNHSGQIPDRAVDTGLIGFYGSVDPLEGGQTSRANANVQLTTITPSNNIIRNQVFYSHYNFELYSNFTFFLKDTVNGDQIRQRESRDLFGYNGSFSHASTLGKIFINSTMGINYRHDVTYHTELSHTKSRSVTLERFKFGNVNEENLGFFIDENIQFSDKWTVNAGVRVDYFRNQYQDLLAVPATTSAVNSSIVSPKLNIYYTHNPSLQFYLNSGKGFHSNDTRVVTLQQGIKTLPAAYGSDLGVIVKPFPRLLINAAAWYLWLDQEFVYVGDEGGVEPSGKSRRMGLDASLRYQITTHLYADADLNTARPRYVSLPEGRNNLPLAPRITTQGGVTYSQQSGVGGSLRYRYMGDRPANEDNSVIAKGYFISDALINYTQPRYIVALSVQNIFNRRWKETQFDTLTRLKGEKTPVDGICFTPGTPFFAKLSVTLFL